jgi:hypothetical protein
MRMCAARLKTIISSVVILGLAGACSPAVIGGGGEGSEGYVTYGTGGVRVYPYGNVFTAPVSLTSESDIAIAYTDSPIQITYQVKSVVMPDGDFYAAHDFDTTSWLGVGQEYRHRGDYKNYVSTEHYEMRGKAVSCLYRDGTYCPIGVNQPDSQYFSVVAGF